MNCNNNQKSLRTFRKKGQKGVLEMQFLQMRAFLFFKTAYRRGMAGLAAWPSRLLASHPKMGHANW